MPLEIAYRPVVLSLAETVSCVQVGSCAQIGQAPVIYDSNPGNDAILGFATAAQNQSEPRARDFVARVQRRDMLSFRGTLYRPARFRQRMAGIVLVGVLPALLAVVGWGDPHGINDAVAQDKPPARHAPANDPHQNPIAAWAPSLADVHSDADSPPPAIIGPIARSLLIAGNGLDRWRAQQCLTAAIYYEAAREPDEGQRAVAQVVLNRVAHAAFPKTVCGVVYQGSERSGCQFSFACDGSLARRPMAQWWERARRVAETALAGNVYAPIGLATHYHTSVVHPAWADSMSFLGTIGAHRFYRWSGSAGRQQAFAAVYAGGEPIAAPHPHSYTTTGADLADPLVLEKAFEAGRLAALRATPAAASDQMWPAATHPASFGQQPPPTGTPTIKPPATKPPTTRQNAPPDVNSARIMPGSGAVRPEAEQQYDGAAHWIHQPGT